MTRRTPTAALVLACALAAAPFLEARAGKPSAILIDADTANEIDDLYAVTRALVEPGLRLLGLSSAQWNHRLSPPDTVLRSQAINEDLLRLHRRQDLPAPLGAEMIVGKPWGGREPRDSPAAQMIIRQARAVPAGERLVVVSLGAVTNLASAVALAPDIVPRLACHVLGGRYDAATRVWNKDEFNVRNDLNAFNLLLDTPGLELHVMPVNVLLGFRFAQEDTFARLAGRSAASDYLVARWLTHAPEAREWIMWDLALVEAVLRPDLASQAEATTPPENAPRAVWMYTHVDGPAMQKDWWARMEAVAAR